MTMKGQRADCLVIGGGLAGAMAALRISQAGREVVLVERERGAHHKVCGEFLSPEAVGYMRAAGVDPVALGAPSIDHLRLATGNRIAECALPFTAYSLSRHVLDAALLGRVEMQGCAVRRGVAVETLTRDGGEWSAQLSGGQVRAQNVFLATGKHDLRGWARPAGRQNDLVGFKMHWRLHPAQKEALRGAMDLFLFRGGYGGLALVEGGAANLCFVVRQSTLRRAGGWPGLIARIRVENRLIRERLDGAEAAWERPLAISSIPYGYLARGSPDCWLLGDQAAVIPSFTGDGMSIALHSGALAAEMFLAGDPAAAYHAALHGQLRSPMRLATALSRAMVTFACRTAAVPAISLYPQAMRWIAARTRIPAKAVLATGRSVPAQFTCPE
jgi:flavin-dependent dehydrogenase